MQPALREGRDAVDSADSWHERDIISVLIIWVFMWRLAIQRSGEPVLRIRGIHKWSFIKLATHQVTMNKNSHSRMTQPLTVIIHNCDDMLHCIRKHMSFNIVHLVPIQQVTFVNLKRGTLFWSSEGILAKYHSQCQQYWYIEWSNNTSHQVSVITI